MTESAQLSQVTTADRAQPALVREDGMPSKRHLRSVDFGYDQDEEERGLEAWKKLLPQHLLDKFQKQTPLLQEIPDEHVVKLLGDKSLRTSTFEYWYKVGIDADEVALVENNQNSVALLKKYVKFLKQDPLLKEIPDEYVVQLLQKHSLRTETFNYWYGAGIDADGAAKVLKQNENSEALLKMYREFLDS